MKFQIFFLIFVSLIIFPLNTYVSAQVPAIGVDESTVIFPGCRLSLLVDKEVVPTAPIENPAQQEAIDEKGDQLKNNYIKSCFQEIIRFVIIIASLAAIISIAVAGLQSMLGDNKPLKGKITNTVIGLFLLIIGWNLLPIFNNSFNNTNFLNLPKLNYCKVANGCTSEEKKIEKRFFICTTRYEQIMDDKEYDVNEYYRKDLIKCVIDFCKVKDKYKDLSKLTCDDIKNTQNEKVVNKKIDDYIEEGKKLRAARNAAGPSSAKCNNTPDADIPKKVIELLNQNKLLDIEKNPANIIKQITDNHIKLPSLKMLCNIVSEFDAVTIYAPYRAVDPYPFHPSGLAVDLHSITIAGKEFTVTGATAGKGTTEFKKLADVIFAGKTSRQILMAGPMVGILKADKNFSAGPGQGTINNIRITTTGGTSPTARHEDHWHIDMFK
jgi:hypothetical protein